MYVVQRFQKVRIALGCATLDMISDETDSCFFV